MPFRVIGLSLITFSLTIPWIPLGDELLAKHSDSGRNGNSHSTKFRFLTLIRTPSISSYAILMIICSSGLNATAALLEPHVRHVRTPTVQGLSKKPCLSNLPNSNKFTRKIPHMLP